ncbi:MAG: tail fiber domain-containing protein [Limnohabitans sp.]
MTTPSTQRKAGPLLGTGVQTTWPFTFKVFAETDIAVTIADSLGVETALVYGADYSVSLNANQETSPGGTVTYPISGAPLPVGSRLVIIGDLDYDQPLDLPSGGNFSPLALENQLDRMAMQIQQLREQVQRALQVSVTTSADVMLPPPTASQLISWDSTGSNLENVPLSYLATALAYGNFRYDTFTDDVVQTQFTLSVDQAPQANLDVAISGVVQVPAIDYTLITDKLVFTSAPPNGAVILARYGEALPSGQSVGSNNVTFSPTGTGATPRSAESKLRDIVHRSDYNNDTNFNNAAAGKVAIDATNKVFAQRFEGTATDDSGTPDAIFRVVRTHTNSASPHSFRDQTVFAPTAAGVAACSFDAAMTSSGSANMDHTIGFQARNSHAGSGTLTNMYGLGSYPIVSSGTVTNCIGLDVAAHSGAGTVVNEYGIYIRNQSSTATNKYPIFIPNSLGTNSIGAATNFNGSGVVSVGTLIKMFMGDGGNGYKSVAYNHNMQSNTYDYGDYIQSMYFGPQDITFRSAPVGVAGATPTFTNIVSIRTDSTHANFRAFFPTTDNVSNLGVSGLRWKEIFCANGTINTSDARLKTEVRDLSAQEIAAAKELAKAIGGFKWLAAVAEKGETARTHIGMTVQRAIEIMVSNGLDPLAYSFICYDEWDAEYEDHPAIHEQIVIEPEEVEIIPAYTTEVNDQVRIDGELRNIVKTVEIPEQRRVIKEAVLGDGKVLQEAWREVKREAGNAYGFRTDQLLMFIARGFEARLRALEGAQ